MASYYPFASILFLLTALAAPSSHLSPGKPLLDGSTLVSSGGIFVLGFFSPNSSFKRYVGIWYSFSPSSVLWVANRESPVPTNSGSLAIAGDGNLVVLDGHGAVLWSSKTDSFLSNNSTAELLDTGNFILKYSSSVLWQSFDHPTDTYLPGMKVGLDLVTNVNQVFTSWRSQSDPAPGKFTLGIAPDQSTQFFIWEDGRPRWRSGRWNGQVFIGIQNMEPTYIYGFKLSNFEQEKKMYFYYSQFNASHRYALLPDGVERHLVWADKTEIWDSVWARPMTQCQIYNRCGNNAACTDSGSSPSCDCLKGFKWAGAGCLRRAPLQCERPGNGGEPDRFYLMQGVKLPDYSDWNSGPLTESQCDQACSSNCSCKAYSFVTGIGCLLWGNDLIDIHVFSNGGNNLYLRLAGSEFDDRKGLTAHIIVIIVFSALFSVGGFFFLYKCKSRIKDIYRKRIKQSKKFVDRSRSVGAPSVIGFSSVIDMQQHGKGENEVRLFSFQIIEEATMNFCSSNLLGEGGFGPYVQCFPIPASVLNERNFH